MATLTFSTASEKVQPTSTIEATIDTSSKASKNFGMTSPAESTQPTYLETSEIGKESSSVSTEEITVSTTSENVETTSSTEATKPTPSTSSEKMETTSLTEATMATLSTESIEDETKTSSETSTRNKSTKKTATTPKKVTQTEKSTNNASSSTTQKKSETTIKKPATPPIKKISTRSTISENETTTATKTTTPSTTPEKVATTSEKKISTTPKKSSMPSKTSKNIVTTTEKKISTSTKNRSEPSTASKEAVTTSEKKISTTTKKSSKPSTTSKKVVTTATSRSTASSATSMKVPLSEKPTTSPTKPVTSTSATSTRTDHSGRCESLVDDRFKHDHRKNHYEATRNSSYLKVKSACNRIFGSDSSIISLYELMDPVTLKLFKNMTLNLRQDSMMTINPNKIGNNFSGEKNTTVFWAEGAGSRTQWNRLALRINSDAAPEFFQGEGIDKVPIYNEDNTVGGICKVPKYGAAMECATDTFHEALYLRGKFNLPQAGKFVAVGNRITSNCSLPNCYEPNWTFLCNPKGVWSPHPDAVNCTQRRGTLWVDTARPFYGREQEKCQNCFCLFGPFFVGFLWAGTVVFVVAGSLGQAASTWSCIGYNTDTIVPNLYLLPLFVFPAFGYRKWAEGSTREIHHSIRKEKLYKILLSPETPFFTAPMPLKMHNERAVRYEYRRRLRAWFTVFSPRNVDFYSRVLRNGPMLDLLPFAYALQYIAMVYHVAEPENDQYRTLSAVAIAINTVLHWIQFAVTAPPLWNFVCNKMMVNLPSHVAPKFNTVMRWTRDEVLCWKAPLKYATEFEEKLELEKRAPEKWKSRERSKKRNKMLERCPTIDLRLLPAVPVFLEAEAPAEHLAKLTPNGIEGPEDYLSDFSLEVIRTRFFVNYIKERLDSRCERTHCAFRVVAREWVQVGYDQSQIAYHQLIRLFKQCCDIVRDNDHLLFEGEKPGMDPLKMNRPLAKCFEITQRFRRRKNAPPANTTEAVKKYERMLESIGYRYPVDDFKSVFYSDVAEDYETFIAGTHFVSRMPYIHTIKELEKRLEIFAEQAKEENAIWDHIYDDDDWFVERSEEEKEALRKEYKIVDSQQFPNPRKMKLKHLHDRYFDQIRPGFIGPKTPNASIYPDFGGLFSSDKFWLEEADEKAFYSFIEMKEWRKSDKELYEKYRKDLLKPKEKKHKPPLRDVGEETGLRQRFKNHLRDPFLKERNFSVPSSSLDASLMFTCCFHGSLTSPEVWTVLFGFTLPAIGTCFFYRHEAAAKMVKYYPLAVNLTMTNVIIYEYYINATVLPTILFTYTWVNVTVLCLLFIVIRTFLLLKNVPGVISQRTVNMQKSTNYSLIAQTSLEGVALILRLPPSKRNWMDYASKNEAKGRKPFCQLINYIFGLLYYPLAVNMTIENVVNYSCYLNFTIIPASIFVYIFITSSAFFCCAIAVRTLILLHTVPLVYSKRTVRLQKDATYSLVAQTLTPVILLAIPLYVFAVIVSLSLYDLNGLIYLCLFMVSIHSIVSNLAFIITTPRFRSIVCRSLKIKAHTEARRVTFLSPESAL
ncbi:unnamed protein product [Caenorhabditis auriculariae]|uniref:Uncharacterized protein n=1 Tax=Caenorhabditis auriculariae TaxID=2777116 RepID=A0A8S1H8T4_9PELO|nr:unnamed protein product [Caenorhabditis auriculariae]